MDFIEKAKIKIKHWIDHNDHHQEEYDEFANYLEKEGKMESARHIREMKQLISKSSESLRKALEVLD